ncbi:hypothetical protein [Robertmurraya sp.]|uniref:hypothetical protein n=1 Tax=Robertmurraya sp. TaxID=2837525 RepID=UPI003704D3F7
MAKHRRGGKREGAGRPGSGLVAKRVALSMPPAFWAGVEDAGVSVSEYLRRILIPKEEPKEEPTLPQLGEIPPINLRSFFYGWTADKIVEWVGGVHPLTDMDKAEHGAD